MYIEGSHSGLLLLIKTQQVQRGVACMKPNKDLSWADRRVLGLFFVHSFSLLGRRKRGDVWIA